MLTSYLGGAALGFLLVIAAGLLVLPINSNWLDDGASWFSLNLGQSIWFFSIVLVFYSADLVRLKRFMGGDSEFTEVARLDQLSDVWIHVFVGVGVVWTAIGMRGALATTLGASGSITEDAGQVLSRLVDGGILLALTTTIVGAVGGYLMRLTKTCWLGAELTEFYHHYERREVGEILNRLESIESEVRSICQYAGAQELRRA